LKEKNLSDSLHRKKELLKKREELLVEIGQDILKQESLPEGHQNLVRDMERTEQMVLERTQRLQQVEGQQIRSKAGQKILLAKLEELLENEKQAIEPLEAQLSQLEPKSPEHTQVKQKLGQKRNQFLLLRQELEERLKEQEKALRIGESEVNDITSAIDLLEETRRKRLRDLAYDFIQKNRKNSLFATQFGYYRLIQLELQELNTPEKTMKGLGQIHNERKNLNWLWIPSIVIITLGIFLFFRNEFSLKNTSFTGLSHAIPIEQGETRILLQEDLANPWLKAQAENALKLAPGIEYHRESSSFSRLLFSILNDGSLGFLAVEYTAPQQNIEADFQKNGWTRQKNHWSVEAFTNNQWVWYRLNPKQYICYPAGLDLPSHPAAGGDELQMLVHTTLPSFGPSYPLIADYSLWHLEQDAHHFAWELKADETPSDLKQRENLLQELRKRAKETATGPGTPPLDIDLQFDSGTLKAEGPPQTLKGWQIPEECIHAALFPFLQFQGQPLHREVDPSCLQALPPSSFRKNTHRDSFEAVLRIHLKDRHLTISGSSRINGRISDLMVEQDTSDLWVLNRALNAILIFDTHSGDLVYKTELNLPDNFKGYRMIPLESGERAILLQHKSAGSSFGMVDLKTEKWVNLTQTPSHILAVYDACLDPASHALFLAVSTKGKRGELGHGLLVYNTASDQFILRQLIDFPIGKTRLTGLSSLVFDSHSQMLYGLNTFQGMLQFFHTENGLIGPKDGVLLEQCTTLSQKRNPVFLFDPRQMTFTRENQSLVMLDFTDFREKKYGDKAFLLDLDSTPPVVIDSLNIGAIPLMVQALPLQNTLLAVSGRNHELVLFHQDGNRLHLDQRLHFNNLIPRRFTVDATGETVYLACKVKKERKP
jgi:hypothetical protein